MTGWRAVANSLRGRVVGFDLSTHASGFALQGDRFKMFDPKGAVVLGKQTRRTCSAPDVWLRVCSVTKSNVKCAAMKA